MSQCSAESSAPAAGRTLLWCRWGGLGAAALLAASAAWAGTGDPAPRVERLDGLRLVGLVGWLSGGALLVTAWWRLRGHQIRSGSGSAPGNLPARWVAVTATLWTLPFLIAPPLASRDGYAYGCQGQLLGHGVDPYLAGPRTLPCSWLGLVPAVWRSAPAPYGPVWLVLAAAVAGLAGASVPAALLGFRLLALAGVGLAAAAGYRLAGRCGVAPASAAWLGLASPLVLVHAVSGAHNDALVAGLVLAGMAVAAGRGPRTGPPHLARAGAAGIAFGLAVGVKATALVAVPFALPLLVDRCRTGPGRWWRAGFGLSTGGAAGYAVFGVPSGLGFGWLANLGRTAGMVQWTSVPTGLGMALGYLCRALGAPAGYPLAVAACRAAGLAVLLVVLLRLFARARRAASVPAAVRPAGLALAAAVLLAPVFYPWYALPALGLVAVSVPDQRVRRAVAAACAALVFLVLPDGYGLAVASKLPGALLDVLAVGALAGWWLRRRLARPAATGAAGPVTPTRR